MLNYNNHIESVPCVSNIFGCQFWHMTTKMWQLCIWCTIILNCLIWAVTELFSSWMWLWQHDRLEHKEGGNSLLTDHEVLLPPEPFHLQLCSSNVEKHQSETEKVPTYVTKFYDWILSDKLLFPTFKNDIICQIETFLIKRISNNFFH